MNKQRILHTIGLGVVSGLAWLAVTMKDSPHWWAPAAATLAAALAVQLPKVAPSIFGPSLPLFLLLALSGGSAGCWLFTAPPPITPTPPDGGFADASAGQTFKDCSETAVHDAILGLLPAVETALATQNYVGELAVLVGKYGIAEVVCAVQYAVERSHRQVMATADPLERTKVTNGRAWLAQHGGTP